MSDLPRFRKMRQDQVMAYISRVLTSDTSVKSHLRKLMPHAAGYYRAVFSAEYFALTEGHAEPTKSQWSTLKKRMKRHNRTVFVFKEYGEIDCPESAERRCYYIDFGFFAE
jgi:hypothetical protein